MIVAAHGGIHHGKYKTDALFLTHDPFGACDQQRKLDHRSDVTRECKSRIDHITAEQVNKAPRERVYPVLFEISAKIKKGQACKIELQDDQKQIKGFTKSLVKKGRDQKIERIDPCFNDPAAPALAEIIKRYGEIPVEKVADDLSYPDPQINVRLKKRFTAVKVADEGLVTCPKCTKGDIEHQKKEESIEIQSLFSLTQLIVFRT